MEFRRLFYAMALLAAPVIVAALVIGCENPGSYGKAEKVVYGRVVVYSSSVEPPMDDPYHDLWWETITGGIFVNDSAFVADTATTFDSLPVSVKAIKTPEYLFIRAEWVENALVSWRTYSVWQHPDMHLLKLDYDSVGHVIDTIYDTWARRSIRVDTIKNIYDTTWLEQDRFAIIWDMGDNGDEKADCRSMCHAVGDTTISGDRMYTTGGGHVDVWHWQAGTTDPVFLAQDEYWSVDGRQTDAYGQEIYTLNYDADRLKPIYMNRDSTKIGKPFLHAVDAEPFDSSRIWLNKVLIPGYVVHDNASGSIADVASFSAFNRTSGRWMVLLRRALNTGNSDDLDLSAIASGDSVMVSLAFMDHSDTTHYCSRPFYIVFP